MKKPFYRFFITILFCLSSQISMMAQDKDTNFYVIDTNNIITEGIVEYEIIYPKSTSDYAGGLLPKIMYFKFNQEFTSA